VIEKLKIKNMTKSATGTVEEPKKSSAKRGLNRVITQQSWGIFFEMLKSKQRKRVERLLQLIQNSLLKNALVVVIYQKIIERVRVSLDAFSVNLN